MQVIDAEMARRKLLEESPIPSTNEEPVFFDTAEIPWWAWVRRFHLPEARCPPSPAKHVVRLLHCVARVGKINQRAHLKRSVSRPVHFP